MTFLKWIGYAVTVLGDITGVLPALKAVFAGTPVSGQVNNIADYLTQIFGVVQQVEVAFAATTSVDAKSGAQKLAAASPGVQAILKMVVESGVLGSTVIANEAEFLAGSTAIASGAAQILNALEVPANATVPTTAQVQAAQANLRATAAANLGGK